MAQQALLLDVGNHRSKWQRVSLDMGTPIEMGAFETQEIDNLGRLRGQIVWWPWFALGD